MRRLHQLITTALLPSIVAVGFVEIESASAQIYVVPRRPGKSQIRYTALDWKHIGIFEGQTIEVSGAPPLEDIAAPADIGPGEDTETSTSAARGADGGLIGSTLRLAYSATVGAETSRAPSGVLSPVSGVSGGIQLYFYDGERPIAERAAAQIQDVYKELAARFRYVPEESLPYVLYSSYQEFLETTLFPVQEGILGVTSTVDVTLALPYFGDQRFFEHVSRHEMVHQFLIQKVRALAKERDTANPLDRMPLWFIEGMAELYAFRGVDSETEMLVRDIILNPDLDDGYGMLDFFADRPGSVLWTYKVGQMRCAFLEDAYGEGIIQEIIEASTWMVADPRDTEDPSARGRALRVRRAGFSGLLEALTGDTPAAIGTKFAAWIQKRAVAGYLDARQAFSTLEPMQPRVPLGEALNVDSLASSPSGHLLLMRSSEPMTGRSRLFLVDDRAPADTRTIATDEKPGMESLRPIYGRSFALSDRALAFVAESGGRDVLYWQAFEHQVELDPELPEEERDSDTELGRRIRYEFSREGVRSILSVAFAPNGADIAFVGLDTEGQRDVYVLLGAGAEGHRVVRLTDDAYAERGIAWGPDGVVFASSATPTGKYNLFRIDPARKAPPAQITNEDRDHESPQVLPDGSTWFTAYSGGSANLYQVGEGGVLLQRSDVTTGLFQVGPAPDGVWALLYHGGRRTPVRIPTGALLSLRRDMPGRAGHPDAIDARPLAAAADYNKLDPANWELTNIFGAAGFGGGTGFGRVLAAMSDELRLNGLLLDISIAGRLELTEGTILYLNQEQRLTWGFGPFQSLLFRLEEDFVDQGIRFFSAERFFGVLGLARWPFSRFTYIQGELAIGGSDFVLTGDVEEDLGLITRAGTDRTILEDWEAGRTGLRGRGEATLRFGWDTIRYAPGTGPLAGRSLLLEATGGIERDLYGIFRVDAQQYIPLIGRSNLFVRGGAGATVGAELTRQFFLSSFDTLRGADFGDVDFLLGSRFFYSTAELQIPLTAILNLAIFSYVEAIAGFDFGGVANQFDALLDNRVLDGVLGVNLGLGPFLLRLHFARPIDIGAPLPANRWVTNFSLTLETF